MTRQQNIDRLDAMIQNWFDDPEGLPPLAEWLAEQDVLAWDEVGPDLLNACRLAEMMLTVEARSHRDQQAPKKAEAVEGAIRTIRKAIDQAEAADAPTL